MTRKPAAEPLYPRAVRLSQADQLRLERLASAMGCSGSEAIRRAVREALERRIEAHVAEHRARWDALDPKPPAPLPDPVMEAHIQAYTELLESLEGEP